jgi:hypothetical protein
LPWIALTASALRINYRKKSAFSKEAKKSVGDAIIKAGFSVGWISAFDDYGRTVWIVDAHREGKRFVVRADEKQTAFVEIESAIRAARTPWRFGRSKDLEVLKKCHGC